MLAAWESPKLYELRDRWGSERWFPVFFRQYFPKYSLDDYIIDESKAAVELTVAVVRSLTIDCIDLYFELFAIIWCQPFIRRLALNSLPQLPVQG